MIDKLAWFCIKNKKILGARSRGQEVYYLPGGKRDLGETDQEALIREIQEELSVNLIPETLRHIHTFQGQAHGKPEGVLVQLSCYTADFNGEIKASAEIEEVSWLSFRDRDLCSATMQMVLDWLKEKNLL
jgi:8-oxo-dGTP pyrophosphatase MutT (NUDIX family)